MPYPVLPDQPGTSTAPASTNIVDLSTTGTISAAQSSINTPVTSATVVLAVGDGQSTWKAQLLAGGGGFTSATTIVADKSLDGGTTWYNTSFKVTGSNPNTLVATVVGPAPLEITGNVAGVTHVRIRCSVLNSTETIAVTLRASSGVSEIGPVTIAGGSVTISNANANGQNVMANSSPVVLASDEIVSVKGSFTEVLGNTVTQSASGGGSGAVAGADLITQMDVSAYKWLSLHIVGAWAGRLTFQCSNDNVSWGNLVLSSLQSQTTSATSTTVSDIFSGPIAFRYFRVRCTTFTSNTSLAGILELYTKSAQSTVNSVLSNQSGTWTTGLSNGDLTLIASAAFTTTQTGADQTNTAARGVRVVLDVTVAGTGSITLEIDAKDTASGKYSALLTGAAVTTNSTNVYVVYPGIPVVANATASDVLPKTWRVKVTANNANSVTYSVGASYLL